MADTFGLKIGVEGEKEFKNALRDINNSFKVLGSEMNLVSSQFGKQDKSMESVTAKSRVLNKEIDAQKQKIATLEQALANASSSFGDADKRTQAWQTQLNNAKAALNGMEKELDDTNKGLDTAGNEFDDTKKQADEFGDEVKKTAGKADDASDRFDKLGGVLKGVGVAAGAALVAIGAAAVGAGKALVDMTVNAASYADDILTQASITGMSTESLQAYKYAAEQVDVSLETLTGSMSKQIKSMSSARDGSAKFADAYAKLGVSVADSNGNLRDSDTVYWETIDALGNVANETERDALAMQIFGKSAQELNPLIDKGSEGIAALTEEAKKMGAVMSDESLNALGTFDDSVQKLTAGGEAAKNMLGTVLLPQLQTLADDGVSLLGEFTTGLAAADGDWGKISNVIGNTVGDLVNMLMENLPNIIQVGLDIVTAIGGAIVENLPIIIDSAIQIIMTLLQALIEALPQITEGALQLVMSLVQGIIDNLPALVEAALQMIITLATGLGEALPELIPAIIDAILLIVETILNNMDQILDAAFAIIEGLATGILNALPRLIEALPGIITSIVDFITNNLPELLEMGIDLIIQLAAGLIQAIPQLVEALPEIVVAILEGIGKVTLSIGDIGKNIVTGIWEGIKSMVSWLQEKIGDFVGGIVTNVEDLLGIHSPSRVFAGIGDNMALGIGEGFDCAMNKVSADMQNAVPTSFDTNLSLKTGSNIGESVIQHKFSGTIRIEGVNDQNQFMGAVDAVIEQLKMEALLAGY